MIAVSLTVNQRKHWLKECQQRLYIISMLKISRKVDKMGAELWYHVLKLTPLSSMKASKWTFERSTGQHSLGWRSMSSWCWLYADGRHSSNHSKSAQFYLRPSVANKQPRLAWSLRITAIRLSVGRTNPGCRKRTSSGCSVKMKMIIISSIIATQIKWQK